MIRNCNWGFVAFFDLCFRSFLLSVFSSVFIFMESDHFLLCRIMCIKLNLHFCRLLQPWCVPRRQIQQIWKCFLPLVWVIQMVSGCLLYHIIENFLGIIWSEEPASFTVVRKNTWKYRVLMEDQKTWYSFQICRTWTGSGIEIFIWMVTSSFKVWHTCLSRAVWFFILCWCKCHVCKYGVLPWFFCINTTFLVKILIALAASLLPHLIKFRKNMWQKGYNWITSSLHIVMTCMCELFWHQCFCIHFGTRWNKNKWFIFLFFFFILTYDHSCIHVCRCSFDLLLVQYYSHHSCFSLNIFS